MNYSKFLEPLDFTEPPEALKPPETTDEPPFKDTSVQDTTINTLSKKSSAKSMRSARKRGRPSKF